MLYSEVFEIIQDSMKESAEELSRGLEKGLEIQQAIGLQIEITNKTLEYLELLKQISK